MAWYTKFPPKQPIRGLSGGGSDDDKEGGSGEDGQGDSDGSNEAIALSGEEWILLSMNKRTEGKGGYTGGLAKHLQVRKWLFNMLNNTDAFVI